MLLEGTVQLIRVTHGQLNPHAAEMMGKPGNENHFPAFNELYSMRARNFQCTLPSQPCVRALLGVSMANRTVRVRQKTQSSV